MGNTSILNIQNKEVLVNYDNNNRTFLWGAYTLFPQPKMCKYPFTYFL